MVVNNHVWGFKITLNHDFQQRILKEIFKCETCPSQVMMIIIRMKIKFGLVEQLGSRELVVGPSWLISHTHRPGHFAASQNMKILENSRQFGFNQLFSVFTPLVIIFPSKTYFSPFSRIACCVITNDP